MSGMHGLGIVLDMDSRWWCAGEKDGSEDRLESLIQIIKFYISFMGNCGGDIAVSIIACFSDRSEVAVKGDWKFCVENFNDEMHALILRRTNRESGHQLESPIAQGISKSILYMKKRECIDSRVIVFDCSRESVDFSNQSVALSNCGWAASSCAVAKCRVHVVSLVSTTPSSNLLSVCSKTGGIHIPMCSGGKLLQSLLFHLTASESLVGLKVRPQSQRSHMGTVCVCHNRSIDKGYVCSICLSIYCNETSGICSVCGSRIRREAKDDLPVNLQIFSKLFS